MSREQKKVTIGSQSALQRSASFRQSLANKCYNCSTGILKNNPVRALRHASTLFLRTANSFDPSVTVQIAHDFEFSVFIHTCAHCAQSALCTHTQHVANKVADLSYPADREPPRMPGCLQATTNLESLLLHRYKAIFRLSSFHSSALPWPPAVWRTAIELRRITAGDRRTMPTIKVLSVFITNARCSTHPPAQLLIRYVFSRCLYRPNRKAEEPE